MIPEQSASFSKLHLQGACRAWGATIPEEATPISSSENLIFKVSRKRGGELLAIRFTHPDHRSLTELEAELAWVSALRNQAVPVVSPVFSENGRLIETLSENGNLWYVSAFSWIDGQPIAKSKKPVSTETIQSWGKLVSQLNAQSLRLSEKGKTFARSHRDRKSAVIAQLMQHPANNDILIDRLQKAEKAVNVLPKSIQNYGLIHSDLHGGNVFQRKDGSLIALDFDDSRYDFFLQDFAMPLYYEMLFYEGDFEERSKSFFQPYLTAYRESCYIDDDEIELLPLFFHLRDLELKAVCLLWEIPADSKWSQRMDEIFRNGNPLNSLPWRNWAKES